MATQAQPRDRVVFGEYELDCRRGELRRNGTALKLQPQPAKVLSILVSRAGEVVTREELTEQVWGSDTHVDFEHGLNYAIRQVRRVLEDDPECPRFLETIPRRGYRFIEAVSNRSALAMAEPVKGPVSGHSLKPRAFIYIAAALAAAIVAGVGWAYLRDHPPTRPRIESVAVLPLHNLSNDPEQEYFSDGMTDELITDLAKSGGLRVISHTSVERYKGTKTSVPQIAKELGVDAIVEGTVMRSTDKVRITAQLIDARSDRHLWADSYERDLRDVLSLQDEVARRITGEIGTNLTAEVPHTSVHEIDPVAHEAYLRGTFYWDQLTCEGYNRARGFFQQTVDKDASFAPAYVGLAQTYFALTDFGCSSDPNLGSKAKAAALKALELDPSSGEAHAWLGKVFFFYEWDFPRAETELRKGTELSPNYATGHFLYGVFLITVGRRELGAIEVRRALELDPISQVTNVVGVYALYLAHQYDAAIKQGKRTLELYPESAVAYYWMGAASEQKSLDDEAVSAYLKSEQLLGSPSGQLAALRSAYQKAGIRGFWQEKLKNLPRSRPEKACQSAGFYAHMGDKERTLQLLSRGQARCISPQMLADPLYDGLRDDPRFKDLMERSRVAL